MLLCSSAIPGRGSGHWRAPMYFAHLGTNDRYIMAHITVDHDRWLYMDSDTGWILIRPYKMNKVTAPNKEAFFFSVELICW